MQKQKFECLEQKKFFERAIKKTGGDSVLNKFGIKKSKTAAQIRIPEIKRDEEEFKPEVESDEDDSQKLNEQAKLSENPPKDPQHLTTMKKYSTEIEQSLPNTSQQVIEFMEENEKLRPTKMEEDLEQSNPENKLNSSERINTVTNPAVQVKMNVYEKPAKLIEKPDSESHDTSEKPRPKKSASKHKRNKKSKGNRMEVDIDDVDEREDQYVGWVPPKNQSGDGRSSLNDKYGY